MGQKTVVCGPPFSGFTSESFEFFRELARNNNKPWFDQNRAHYEEHVTGAFRALLSVLEPFLLDLNPHFETSGKTNRNFSRINRDIRFSKDKSPYKQNYYLYVFDSRRDRQTDGRLYVGLSAECVTVGFSIYGTWKPGANSALETVFRKRLRDEPKDFHRLCARIVRGRRYETYWYRQEQGKGEWAQHAGLPRRPEDSESLQAWVVRKVFLPQARTLGSPAFARQVQRIFAELYPLYVFSSEASPSWKAQLRRAARLKEHLPRER